MAGAALLAAGEGGIARVARLTARTLIESGADVSLQSLLDRSPENLFDHGSRTAYGNKLRFLARNLAGIPRCSHFIYDSVGTARAHARFGERKLRPFAVWMHGIEVWHALTPAKLRILRAADRTIVNSHYTLRTHQDIHGALENARVCWLGTETDDLPEQPPDFSGPPTVLILGRIDGLDPYKGHGELISAWPSVVGAIPEARLVIAGGGPGLKDVMASVAKSPVRSSIDVLGFVPEHELPELWRRAHVFSMPSRKEGFGLVYIEAMRWGIPVVGSVHDAAPEVNVDEVTGYNVNLDRHGQLTERLIELLKSPDLCRRMGHAGQRRWSEHFSWSSFRRRFEPIMESFVTDS